MTPNEMLFKQPYAVSPRSPEKIDKYETTSLQHRILLRAMVDAYSDDHYARQHAGSVITQFTIDARGARIHDVRTPHVDEIQAFIERYRKNPIMAANIVRENLMYLMQDQR